MLMTTAPFVEGYRVRKYGPLVAAEAVMGANIFTEFFARVTDVVGGRSGRFQDELARARTIVMDEMARQTEEAGCNAVIAIDLDYSEISGAGKSMLMVAGQGTAVYIEPANAPVA